LRSGAPDEPGVVYLGTDPDALFRSADNGATWEMVEALTKHATREKWTPGAGGLMVHSIQALGKGRLIVGIHPQGVPLIRFPKTWELFNGKVPCDFRPDRFTEVGQCVHKPLAHARQRGELYQQYHCGVYLARFTATNWQDISKGLPARFGFAAAVPAAKNGRCSRFRSRLQPSDSYPKAS